MVRKLYCWLKIDRIRLGLLAAFALSLHIFIVSPFQGGGGGGRSAAQLWGLNDPSMSPASSVEFANDSLLTYQIVEAYTDLDVTYDRSQQFKLFVVDDAVVDYFSSFRKVRLSEKLSKQELKLLLNFLHMHRVFLFDVNLLNNSTNPMFFSLVNIYSDVFLCDVTLECAFFELN